MARAFSQSEQARIRARLLEAAAEAVLETGFKNTPVEALTQSVGISKGAFYSFFPSKAALWMAMLSASEASMRAELTAIVDGPPEGLLDRTLRFLFAASTRPGLQAMRDPEDLAWLLRALPEGALASARADDDAWFAALLDRLIARGAVAADTSALAFAGIAPTALAIAQGEALTGAAHEAVVELLIEGLVLRLSPSR
ncbi:MAG: TetR/AcrR family transcriptional regulator [Proteobacteria bacterium]|nr:TetR/AcrR family transcriptional regulator [Pseudomonadota bacterium]